MFLSQRTCEPWPADLQPWPADLQAVRRRQKRGRSHAKKRSALARGALRAEQHATAEPLSVRTNVLVTTIAKTQSQEER